MKALRERPHLKGMLLFFIVIVISVLLSDNTNKAFSFLDPRLSLFYFPLAIGTLSLRKPFRDRVLLGFAWLTTAVGLFCLLYGLQRSAWLQNPALLYNDSLTEPLGQQSIYIALLVNFSIYVFCYFILFRPARYKWTMVAGALFLFGFSYLLASRIMMGTLYVVTLGFALYYIILRRNFRTGMLVLILLAGGALLSFKFFPQTRNRFRELTHTEFNFRSMGRESHYNMAVDSTQWNGANFRMAAWQCGWELFRANPIMGVHIGDKRDALFEIYRQKDFQFALQTNKNVHNNYLDILYSMGVVGLLAFLAGWIVLPLLLAVRKRDGLAILIIITFAAAWITENYFDRNLGGMLTGFFIPFLLTIYQKDEDA
jgi:O-antigen ligase